MPLMTKEQARQLNALQLAFIGDTVCDLIARTHLMYSGLPVKSMHGRAAGVVNARAQAQQLDAVAHLLDETENAIVQRARNAHPDHSIPRNATREEYLKATAFEAVMGYLYLTGQMLRAQKLFSLSRIEKE